MQFNVGDIVKLKSGGPVMTVEEVGDDYVSCCWFDDKGIVQRNSFNQAMVHLWN